MSLPLWLRPLAARLNRLPIRRTVQRPRFRPSVEGLEDRLVPATVTVTSTLDTTDTGDGVSLREAISSINAGMDFNSDVAHTGTYGINDTIDFALPDTLKAQDGDWWTIQPLTALPTLTDTVLVDGWSQGGSGYHGAPRVLLDGTITGAAADGLDVGADGCTIRGLAISSFTVSNGSGGNGSGIYIGGANATIQGCYLGLNPSGNKTAFGNDAGVGDFGLRSMIGGVNPGEGNVISGNGIGIASNGAATIIRGNRIGTNPAGTAAIPNEVEGISIAGPSALLAATVGGSGPGEGNLISGNAQDGMSVGNNVLVLGNLIGTDVTGMQPLGNVNGIFIPRGTSNVVIGGTDAGSRNVISANTNGIEMQGDANFGVVVQGNYIGTDVSGAPTLGNRREGIGASSNLLIGGMEAGACNLIAGNGDAVGLYGSNDQVIGNVIRNNSGAGVGSRGTNNQIIGNVIHDNGGAGVQINGGVGAGLPANDYAQGNTVSANSIYANGGLDIDLQTSDASHLFTGVTLNDSMGHDGNDGPNHFQNFPELASVSGTTNSTTVTGTLTQAVTPDTSFRIEFFANTYEGSLASDGLRYGEGQRYIGYKDVMTDEHGVAQITTSGLLALNTGERFITATATNLATGDTSEFSAAFSVPTKAMPTITTTGGCFTYDGQPHPATGSVIGPSGENLGTPTFSHSYTDDNGNVITQAGRPVEPGYYTVTASFAGDANYLPASKTVCVTIYYESHTLTDLSQAFHAGRTIPIKIQLTDANGNNLSSSGIDLTAIRLERENADGSRTEVALQDAGNSNPGNLFRYDSSLGGYIFNLSTKNLGAGTYDFYWVAEGEPTEHTLRFDLI